MTKTDQIDSALRLIDREIWIVTAADGPSHKPEAQARGSAASQRWSGLVATWVSSASIDRQRPVLLAGLAPNHFTTELVQASKAFAAHLLRPEQTELAWNFADGSGRDRDKFACLEVETHETGSPILTDCLAWFDCRVFARFDAGDRLFFWADIVKVGPASPDRPEAGHAAASLIALREQRFFQSLTKDRRQHLAAARDADAAHLHPLHEKWRSQDPW